MGCHSITFTENPAALGLPSFHQDHWDPMWDALVDVGIDPQRAPRFVGAARGHRADAPMDVMITLQPMNICAAAADLVWSRVFKKYADLKVALSEGGTGWIPYFLDRLDRTYDMHHAWTGQDFGDGRMPSDVFREHILTCFITDPVGLRPARRDRRRQHVLGAGLPALGLVVAHRARGAPRDDRAASTCPTPT